MRLVLQRVSEAAVSIAGETVGRIGAGLVVLLAIAPSDGPDEVGWAADKIAKLRIFNDIDGKMNLSLLEEEGEALIVSQFTLYGDARKGRRPSFVRAGSGPEAEELYEQVIERLRRLGVSCASGRFGASMQVSLINDGPVTILLDSEKAF